MAERVSAAQAKARLSELMARVAHGGEHFLIERRGKPLAALVNVDDLEQLERGRALSGRPQGALALVGAWGDIADEDLNSLVQDIYAERPRDTGRPVSLDI